ncbi:MAG: helix-turn-helix transcriptional regulator [Firmicutes bacterium]|nr:helix-turn-helix transcriptional regulator [Bacillota bacterium]
MFNGKRLKELRTSMGLTQKQLGDLVNVTKVSICGYEKSNRTPNIETLIDLANILNTTPNYLLDSEVSAKVMEEKEEYSVSISSEDMEILRELKKYPDLYTIIKDNPKRLIEKINKKIN